MASLSPSSLANFGNNSSGILPATQLTSFGGDKSIAELQVGSGIGITVFTGVFSCRLHRTLVHWVKARLSDFVHHWINFYSGGSSSLDSYWGFTLVAEPPLCGIQDYELNSRY